MKKRITAIILLIQLLTVITASVSYAENNTVENAKCIFDGIIAFKIEENGLSIDNEYAVQSLIDGEISKKAGSSSADWYAFTLSRIENNYDYSNYRNSIENYIENRSKPRAVELQRCALVYHAIGGNTAKLFPELSETVGAEGIMSYIYGLHLLSNGIISAPDANEIIKSLLALKLSDGGFALNGDKADTDVTAMVLQALSPYYNGKIDDTIDNELMAELKSTVSEAIDKLSLLQNTDGDFSSYGITNAESTAQVLITIASLGIDINDTRFVKNGNTVLDALLEYGLECGGFSHLKGGEFNSMATVQVFMAASSLMLRENNDEILYIFKRQDSYTATPIFPDTTNGKGSSTIDENRQISYEKSDNNTTDNKDSSNIPKTSPIKLSGALLITALAGIICIILIIRRRKKAIDYILVIGTAMILLVLLFNADIKTAREYYGSAEKKENIIGTVTLSIKCSTVAGRGEYIPSDGVILEPTVFSLGEDDTVYDILTDAAREYSIQLEIEGADTELAYIAGIAFLYEFDFGELSGWIYRVNGDSPSVGCGAYTLSDGDIIEWLYSCELGEDLN